MKKLTIYFVLFWFLNALRAYTYYHPLWQFDLPFGLSVIPFTKIMAWIGPVLLYLFFVDKDKHIAKSLKLKDNVKKGILWGVAAGLIQMGYTYVADQIWGDGALRFSFTASSFTNAVLLVGFIEEIPFRGFILQKLMVRMTFVKANLLTALLFLSMHFPGWIFSGAGIRPATSLSVFALGYVFGWLVYKSQSLWSSIVFHSMNNFTSIVIFSLG